MCLIKVIELFGSKPVDGDAGDWTRYDCTVLAEVDGKPPVRLMVKTFDKVVWQKLESFRRLTKDGVLPPSIELKAKPFERGETVSYTVYAKDNPSVFPDVKKGVRGGVRGGGMTNRQVAFEAANRLVSAGLSAGLYECPADAASETLEIASRYLGFLDGKSEA